MTDFMYNALHQFDLNEARDEGLEEGRKQGRDEGLAQGLAKGRDEGLDEAFRLTDRLMENNDMDTLRRLSSMTKEELKTVYLKYGLQPPQGQ